MTSSSAPCTEPLLPTCRPTVDASYAYSAPLLTTDASSTCTYSAPLLTTDASSTCTYSVLLRPTQNKCEQQLQQQNAQHWEEVQQQWMQLHQQQHAQQAQQLQQQQDRQSLHALQQKTSHQPQRIRRTGQCVVCLRVLSLTAAGLIHQHGPSPGCPGTGRPPVDGSACLKDPELNATLPSTSTASSNNNSQHDLLQSIRSERCRLLKRIPKASRTLAAEKLAAVLSRIVANPDDVSAWSDLLYFSFACFAVPGGRGGKNHQSSLTSKFNSALNAYPNRQELASRSSQSKSKISKRKTTTAENIASRISEKLEEGDVRGAIRIAASDDTLARPDEKTLDALRVKHPPRMTASSDSLPSTDSQNNSPPLVVQERAIIDAIKSFPAGSAGGVDGLRPQYLKDMISVQNGDAGDKLLARLTEFSNLCLSGKVPLSIRPIFCGASLCALNKKDGGIRPIAVGCTLRRLVAKAASKLVQEKMASKMAPVQLGFGVKHGTEAASHAARRFLENMIPGQAILKLDFANAFNSLSREVLLHTIYDELPELYPFVSTCYSSSSHLCFGEFLISSEEGAQQGDPLGPLLFCATSLRLAKLMKAPLNIWYMDDGTLGGDVEVLINDYLTVQQVGSSIGLQLNEHKCELITDNHEVLQKFKAIAPSIQHIDVHHSVLLGAPIGNKVGIDAILSKKLEEFQRLANTLKLLSAHDAFFLLKNCFSLPKLQYILRCAPCFESQILSQYDDTIRESLQSILNITLSEQAWLQATLPIKRGGLGVRLASQVALPAFLASCGSTSELVQKLLPTHLNNMHNQQFAIATDIWKGLSGQNESPLLAVSQKAWDTPLVEVTSEQVLSAAQNQVGLARLIAAAAPHSGAFLQAMPCSAVGTRLDDASLRIAVALRLGASVCAPHSCVCGGAVDEFGAHGLSCRKSAGRHSRHSALNDIIKRSLATAEIPSRLEPTSLARSDGKRPDGMSMMPWKQGRCLVWDVTCPDTLASSHLNHAVTGAGEVATVAESNKRTKYEEIARTFHFIPIAVETLGALGVDATAFFKDLGSRIKTVTQERRAYEFLMQRVSVAIQRGNAACILGTLPSNANLDEIFYLV